MNGIRLGLYETLKNLTKNYTSLQENYTPLNIIKASLSGFLGGYMGTPFQLIKTRIQSNSYGDVNFKYQYTGVINGLVSIYKEGGLRTLYSGANIFGLRTCIGSSVQLPMYDLFKDTFIKMKIFNNDFSIYIASSFGASILASLAMNPFDCISTRIFNQKYDHGKGLLYTSISDCFIKTVKAEGINGLYKGLTAQIARLAPHSILGLTFLEHLKKSSNKLKSFKS